MPQNYSKWVSNSLQFASGRYWITILRGVTDYALGITNIGTLELDPNIHLLLTIGDIPKTVNKDDAQITMPKVELLINDSFNYSGTYTDNVGGVSHKDVDLDPDKLTLVRHIFSDEYDTYRLFVERELGATRECIFIGEIIPGSLTSEEGQLFKPHTSDERIISTYKVSVNALVNTLKDKTVNDFVGACSDSDMLGNYIFLGGITVKTIDGIDQDVNNILITKDDGTRSGFAIDEAIRNHKWEGIEYLNNNFYTILSHGISDSSDPTHDSALSFPLAHWGMSLISVFRKISEVCGLLFFDTSFFQIPFEVIGNKYDLPNSRYVDTDVIADSSDATQLSIYYNYLFGVSPLDGSPFTSPITFERTVTLSEVLKRFALDWGCYVWPYIDSTLMEEGFKVLPINANTGGLPTNWKEYVSEAKEEPRGTRKAGVIVKHKAEDGGIKITTAKSGDYVTIEVLLRTRDFGSNRNIATSPPGPTWEISNVIIDPNKLTKQGDYCLRFDGSKPGGLSEEGWLMGSYYFHLKLGEYYGYPPGANYPPGDLVSGFLGLRNDDNGYYALRGITHKPGSWSANHYENHYGSKYAIAQLYAREYFGSPVILTRTYKGVLHDNGLFNDVGPGLRATWWYAGKLRTFRVVETTQQPAEDKTVAKFIEDVDITTLNDFPIEIITDGNGATGNATGGTNTGNTDTAISSIVRLNNLDIIASAVVKEYTELHTYASATVQLVVDDPTLTKNGLWNISSGGVKTRFDAKYQYGLKVFARDDYSVNALFGGDTEWILYGNFSNINTPLIVDTDNQHWQQLLIAERGDSEDDIFVVGPSDSTYRKKPLSDLLPKEFVSQYFDSVTPYVLISGTYQALGTATAIDMYCQSPNGPSPVVTSLTPLVYTPTLAGVYRVTLAVDAALTPIFTSDVEIWANWNGGINRILLDRRFFDTTQAQTLLFLTGSTQFLFDGVTDNVRFEIRSLAVLPMGLTFMVPRFEIEYVSDDLDCTPP